MPLNVCEVTHTLISPSTNRRSVQDYRLASFNPAIFKISIPRMLAHNRERDSMHKLLNTSLSPTLVTEQAFYNWYTYVASQWHVTTVNKTLWVQN